MTRIQEIFAYNLKKKRHESGLSQAKLAEMVSVSTHHMAMMEISRNYPTLDLIGRIAIALNIEIYELFIDPLSPPVEMERLYEITAKNIDQLISSSMDKFCQAASKNIELAVGKAVENALANKQ